MKNNKKQFNARPENEPRISVRPGNFIVPGDNRPPAAKEMGLTNRQSKKTAVHAIKRATLAHATIITSTSVAVMHAASAARRSKSRKR